MNYYIAYELRICSDIEIPELLLWPNGSEGAADVHIVEGDLSCVQEESLPQVGPFLFANEDNVLLTVADIARYWIQSGNRITYQKLNGSSDDDVRAFLLGSCIGAILMQRDFFVLHGCTIKVGEGCIVFVGPSTSGKSTIAASFKQSGYSILSDDVCAIDSSYRAVPGIPRIKINKDVANHFGINTDNLNIIRASCDNKFSLPLGEQFCETKLPVLGVYELSVDRGNSTAIKNNLQQIECFSALSENLYRPRYVQALQKKSVSFQHCCKLAEQANVARIIRPTGSLKTDEIKSLILKDLQNLSIIEDKHRLRK